MVTIYIIGLCVGFGISTLIFLPKVKRRTKENLKIQKLNEQYQLDLENCIQKKNSIISDIQNLNNEKDKLQNDLQDIQTLINTGKKIAETAYEEKIELMQEKFEIEAEKLGQQYQSYENDLKEEYLTTAEDCANELKKIIDTNQLEIIDLEEKLSDLKDKVKTAVQANIREEEIRNKNNFYRLELSELDIQEIKRLREIEPYLRDNKPLNKVIWKVYYEHPFNLLIGRILGTGRHSGIYKITNLENKMCYIGQSVNLKERLRQHVRRGIGADEATKNRLYPAMQTFGVENFSFEILEKCEEKKLNEREKYWIEYFHGQEFGYNSTSGNK